MQFDVARGMRFFLTTSENRNWFLHSDGLLGRCRRRRRKNQQRLERRGDQVQGRSIFVQICGGLCEVLVLVLRDVGSTALVDADSHKPEDWVVLRQDSPNR